MPRFIDVYVKANTMEKINITFIFQPIFNDLSKILTKNFFTSTFIRLQKLLCKSSKMFYYEKIYNLLANITNKNESQCSFVCFLSNLIYLYFICESMSRIAFTRMVFGTTTYTFGKNFYITIFVVLGL